MKIRTRKSGFTLIELVVVIAVIAILAALLLPTILGQVERARLARAKSDVKEIAVAIARLRTDTGVSTSSCLTDFANLTDLSTVTATACQPTNQTGNLPLCSTDGDPALLCWGGPYISNVTDDPWSQSYYASEDLTSYIVTVYSNGPDTSAGTSDDLTFIQ